MVNKEVRIGTIRAQVLHLVCMHPESACGNAITNKLRAKYGTKYTHSLEVGDALKWLAQDGVLRRTDPSPKKIGERLMYEPTAKAGFYLGLAGTPA